MINRLKEMFGQKDQIDLDELKKKWYYEGMRKGEELQIEKLKNLERSAFEKGFAEGKAHMQKRCVDFLKETILMVENDELELPERIS